MHSTKGNTQLISVQDRITNKSWGISLSVLRTDLTSNLAQLDFHAVSLILSVQQGSCEYKFLTSFGWRYFYTEKRPINSWYESSV